MWTLPPVCGCSRILAIFRQVKLNPDHNQRHKARPDRQSWSCCLWICLKFLVEPLFIETTKHLEQWCFVEDLQNELIPTVVTGKSCATSCDYKTALCTPLLWCRFLKLSGFNQVNVKVNVFKRAIRRRLIILGSQSVFAKETGRF